MPAKCIIHSKVNKVMQLTCVPPPTKNDLKLDHDFARDLGKTISCVLKLGRTEAGSTDTATLSIINY